MSNMRFQVYGQPNKSGTVENGATRGAIVGVNLYLTSGELVTEQMLFRGALQTQAVQAGGTAAWGSITGTLSSQTDLVAALGAKLDDSQATPSGLAILGAADAAAQRTALDLGTAAVKNTGTSGDAVPLLNAANTWSGIQTVNANIYSNGTFRVTQTSSSGPSTGEGLEHFYTGGIAYSIAYDRSGALWKEYRLYGLTLEFYVNGAYAGRASSTGLQDAVGNVRDINVVTRNSTTAFSSADRGKAIVKDNTTAYSWAVDTGVFSAGMAITVINDGTAGDVTISQGAGMTLISGLTTGNFTLTPGQSRTLLALSSTRVRVL